MVQWRNQGRAVLIATAQFDPQRALTGGGKRRFRWQALGDALGQTQPLQTRHRQDNGVVAMPVELLQPGIDVAAQEPHFEVGAQGPQLAFAAQAGSADDTAGGQRVQAGKVVAQEGIAGIFALTDCPQLQSRWKFHRHVFHRMHRQVRPFFQQRGFQPLDEQALASQFGQRSLLQLVPPGTQRQQFHGQPRVDGAQAFRHVPRLPQRQRAGAGGNAKRLFFAHGP